MRVNVKLFARLRELVGTGEMAIDVAAGASVRDVWQALVVLHPAAAQFERSMSCAVNLDYARMTTPVSEGDDVAFLPPVSGGSDAGPR